VYVLFTFFFILFQIFIGDLMNLFEKHEQSINTATKAFYSREFYVHYPEMPSPKNYGEGAADKGLKEYNQMLGQFFDTLKQEKDEVLMSDETSCFDLRNIGNFYPILNDPAQYVKNAKDSLKNWKNLNPEVRAGLLMESLEQMKEKVFEIAYSSMHTTGKGFMMAFQASGPHAFDRCIEAIVAGLSEQKKFPEKVNWTKPMGKFDLKVKRSYKPHPLGVSLAIGCSTFPIWNSLPGVFASLVTGNTCIVKPHPTSIFPLAICVSIMQKVLADNDFNPLIVQLACDSLEKPITKDLAENPMVKIIDFTGSSSFGNYVQGLVHKKVFAEQNGVNNVIIESCEDFSKVAKNLAFSVCLYSSQMCTAPQNFFICKDGITSKGETLGCDQVMNELVTAIDQTATNPKGGAATLGAIQSENTLKRIQQLQSDVESGKYNNVKVLKGLSKVENPEFSEARTYSPLILEVDASEYDFYSSEHFGPVVLLIKSDSNEQSLDITSKLIQENGALSFSLYSTNKDYTAQVEEEMFDCQVNVTLNFTGFIWMNQSLGFSDFHGTGGNKAANCSLVDSNFVSGRFNFLGTRTTI
jgi:phenylacetic acid degradation protein paaN